MLPTTLIAGGLLVALVPGFLYLQLTSEHRRSAVRLTALEELFRLLTAGLMLSAPVVALHLTLFPGLVEDAFTTPSKGPAWDADRLQSAGVLALSLVAGGLVVAWIMAADFRRRNPRRTSESVWDSTFDPEPRGIIPVCHVTLVTGKIVTGVVHSVDSLPIGLARDLALKAPFRAVRPDGERQTHTAGRIVLSESQIHSTIVTFEPPADDPSESLKGMDRLRFKVAQRLDRLTERVRPK